jgi:hypothetical protein
LKETTKAYAAGLIDAEGGYSISVSTNKLGYKQFDPMIRFTTTYRPVVNWMVKHFGGVAAKPKAWDVETGWKDYSCWKFSSDKHASRFLVAILPYIWMKRDEALVLREYFELNGKQDVAGRESLVRKLAEAKNNRESVTTNTPGFPQVAKAVHAYLAGVFDGEGSAYIVKFRQGQCDGYGYRAGVSLGNTFQKLVLEMQRIYGGVWRERPPHNGTLPMYEWELKRQEDQERFLLAMLPYLQIKREQANLVLQFIRLRGERSPEKREVMYQKVRALNGKKRESELAGNRESGLTVT